MKTAMNMMDLLRQTNSYENGADRIELVELPRDVMLKPRHAVVVAGEHSLQIVQMIAEALDRYFDRAIKDAERPGDTDGPDPGAARS